MRQKKLAIVITLAFLSILQAGVLGKLDFFGFLDGRHQISTSLFILSLLIGYLTTISVFLIEFSQKHRLRLVFLGCSVLFTITFFIVNGSFEISAVTGLLFVGYLLIAHNLVHKRSKVYVRFSPTDVLTPVVRASFTFILALFATLNFFSAQVKVNENALFAPKIVRPLTKPVVQIVNKQLTLQMRAQLDAKLPASTTVLEREKIIRTVLKETVLSLGEENKGYVFGIPASHIDTNKVLISPSGDIDITPTIDAVIPDISSLLNQQVRRFYFIAPFVVALLTFILLQPLFVPLSLIEIPITKLVFYILFKTKFLQLKKEMKEVDTVGL